MIRTRIAPSPTGKLHLGTSYAALWPYLYARKAGGKFILRVEDTDRERSTKEFAENIIEGLKWLGLEWDEGPFYQMDRLNLYNEYCQKLIKEKKAYYCFCTKEQLEEERKRQTEKESPQVYSGKCRQENKQEGAYVVRFKMPDNRGAIEFDDLIHGKISFDSKLIGDFVIMRQNGIPLYNFAVVVDDIEMEITHVLRGDDHISNTPKQIVLFEALSKTIPTFSHYPMILNQDRSGKLSKRTGSTALEDYKHEGYLPEAIINYLALLGWTPPDDREILARQELVNLFDIKDMNDAPAAWNKTKLDWINGEYIRALSDEQLTDRLHEFLVDHLPKEKIAPVVPLVKERIKKLSDFVPLTLPLFNPPEYDKGVFEKLSINNDQLAIEKIIEKLEELNEPWEQKEFEKTFRSLAQELGISNVDMFQLIRVVVFGQLVTPPLLESMKIIGERESIERAKKALIFLKS